jgi:hypothetical protein
MTLDLNRETGHQPLRTGNPRNVSLASSLLRRVNGLHPSVLPHLVSGRIVGRLPVTMFVAPIGDVASEVGAAGLDALGESRRRYSARRRLNGRDRRERRRCRCGPPVQARRARHVLPLGRELIDGTSGSALACADLVNRLGHSSAAVGALGTEPGKRDRSRRY